MHMRGRRAGAGPAPKFMGLVGPAPVAKTPPESTRTATTVRPDNVGARSAAVHRVRRRLRPSTPHLRQSPSHAARQRLAQVPRPRRHAQRVELHRKPVSGSTRGRIRRLLFAGNNFHGYLRVRPSIHKRKVTCRKEEKGNHPNRAVKTREEHSWRRNLCGKPHQRSSSSPRARCRPRCRR